MRFYRLLLLDKEHPMTKNERSETGFDFRMHFEDKFFTSISDLKDYYSLYGLEQTELRRKYIIHWLDCNIAETNVQELHEWLSLGKQKIEVIR